MRSQVFFELREGISGQKVGGNWQSLEPPHYSLLGKSDRRRLSDEHWEMPTEASRDLCLILELLCKIR